MKYICVLNPKGIKEVIIFPRQINHDVMAKNIARMKNQAKGNWIREQREIISAGFITSDLKCHGRSETLGLDSRPEDSDILARQLYVYQSY